MKFKLPHAIAISIILIPPLLLRAEMPEAVHYQGRVTVAGEAFDGTGQFKFAMVDDGTENVSTATARAKVTSGFVTAISVSNSGNGYTTVPTVTLAGGSGSGATATASLVNGRVSSINVNNAGSGYNTAAPTVVIASPPPASIQTLWSNNGTSSNGSAPTASVTLSVSSGVFSVILGDTSLPDMIALPAATFASSPVRLRVWFNGGSGFELLTPDQPITATPYAMRADCAREASSLVEGAVQENILLNGWIATTNTNPLELRAGDDRAFLIEPVGIMPTAVSSAGPNIIGGWEGNGVSFDVVGATISGGGGILSGIGSSYANLVTGSFGTVGGGLNNWAGVGWYATVSGGLNNAATGLLSTVSGGVGNIASGFYATVVGGEKNSAIGRYSFAGGRRAQAIHDGAFIWADSTYADFSSVRTNQFKIRANGGAEFQTGTRGMTVFSNSTASSGAAIQAESTNADGIALVARNTSTDSTLVLNNGGTGPIIKAFNIGAVRLQLFNNGNLNIGGTLSQNSDKHLKQDIEKLDGVLGAVLSLQPASYRMKERGDESGRLYGFIAQEVREVFPAVVNEDAESGLLSLSYSDFSVLAIQAIKEQQEIIKAQAERIGALEKAASRSEQLEARLVALESLVTDEPVAAR